MVFKKFVAQRRTQHHSRFNEASVAFPGLGIEQFLFFLLGQPFLGSAFFFIRAGVLGRIRPFGQILFDGIRNLSKVHK